MFPVNYHTVPLSFLKLPFFPPKQNTTHGLSPWFYFVLHYLCSTFCPKCQIFWLSSRLRATAATGLIWQFLPMKRAGRMVTRAPIFEFWPAIVPKAFKPVSTLAKTLTPSFSFFTRADICPRSSRTLVVIAPAPTRTPRSRIESPIYPEWIWTSGWKIVRAASHSAPTIAPASKLQLSRTTLLLPMMELSPI